MREVRIKGLGMRNWASSMGLLGLFLSTLSLLVFHSPGGDGRRRGAAIPCYSMALRLAERKDDRGLVVLLLR